jgi:hypothetical protein
LAELDSTHTHLDDVESLVIRVDFPLLLTTVDVVLEMFLDEALGQGCQDVPGLLHITQDDGTFLARDGLDSQFFREYHPSVRVLGYLLGKERESEKSGGDGRNDILLHIPVDFSF